MRVFKIYAKLVRANRGVILIYLAIFAGMTLLITRNIPTTQPNFENRQAPIVWVDEDQTDFTLGLKEFVSKYAVFIDPETIDVNDAFFYRAIEAVYVIPSGYTNAFTSEDPIKIETRYIENSFSRYSIESAVQKYLDLAYIYIRHSLVDQELSTAILDQLAKEAEIEFIDIQTSAYRGAHFFYNTLAYILFALIITVVGTVMFSFKPIDIKRRNDIGMISNKRMNVLLFIANGILGLFFLAILIAVSILLYPSEVLTTRGSYMILNSVVFTISAIALAYMISVLFKARNVISAMGTIVSLGGGFITGVFIPQIFLDSNILFIARIIPSYWYVKANDEIVYVTQFTWNSLDSIFVSMLAQIVLTVIFILVALTVARKRRQQEL